MIVIIDHENVRLQENQPCSVDAYQCKTPKSSLRVTFSEEEDVFEIEGYQEWKNKTWLEVRVRRG
jgi:hypothetical protein